MFYTVETTLASAVAKDGAFNVAYPSGTQAGTFSGGHAHKLFAIGTKFSAPTGITVSFGASNITVTYKGETTIPANSRVLLNFDTLGLGDLDYVPGTTKNIATLVPVVIDLGAPLTADADGILDDAAADDAPSTITSFLKSVMDVPRNIVLTGTAGSNHVVTITGKDAYGKTLVEAITLNGTNAVAGKKAFAEIVSMAVAAGAADDTFDAGWGDVLGIPVFLPGGGYVVRELQDGAVPTAGTFVAGATAAPTATTGDVRGTYDPNAAADGSKVFRLIAMLEDPSYQGLPQFAG